MVKLSVTLRIILRLAGNDQRPFVFGCCSVWSSSSSCRGLRHHGRKSSRRVRARYTQRRKCRVWHHMIIKCRWAFRYWTVEDRCTRHDSSGWICLRVVLGKVVAVIRMRQATKGLRDVRIITLTEVSPTGKARCKLIASVVMLSRRIWR